MADGNAQWQGVDGIDYERHELPPMRPPRSTKSVKFPGAVDVAGDIRFQYDGRVTLYLTRPGHDWSEMPLVAVCERCQQLVLTGRVVVRSDLDGVDTMGTFRCRCSGQARVPEYYAIYSREFTRQSDGTLRPLKVIVNWPNKPDTATPTAYTARQFKQLADVAAELKDLRTRMPQVEAELQELRRRLNELGDKPPATVEVIVQSAAPTAAPLVLRILRDPAFSGVVSAVGLVLALLALIYG